MIFFIKNIGKTSISFLSSLGRISIFMFLSIKWIIFPPYYFRQFSRQVIDIGFFSLPVVGLTTLFQEWF